MQRGERFLVVAIGALVALLGTVIVTDVHAADRAASTAPAVASGVQVGRSMQRWSGQAAVDRLGDRLPAVAAASRMTPAQLRRLLLTDATANIDKRDAVFFVDDPVRPGAVSAAASWGPFDPDSSIPDGDTFLLHSKPGSSRVIHLDFTGELLRGTAWNDDPFSGIGTDCQAQPFDLDGNAASFTTSELATIKSVWRRVAEDYAAFDVDVTTQDPGADAINRTSSADTFFGARVVITGKNLPCYPGGPSLYTAVCPSKCGGIAYLGVFDAANSGYNQPALVFADDLAGGTVPKYLAEAASHEVGHNVGLGHDGTSTLGYYEGQGSWAPIMGAGYYRPIVQWSKGEYTGANNTQDDLAVMATYGLAQRADDHGDTTATATGLSGTLLAVDGVISTATDVDAFLVRAGAGAATFTVSPSIVSPDLDVRLELRDSSGTLLSSDDPASGGSGDTATGMSASISYTFATSGTYTLLVDGVGAGTATSTGYSDYASTGSYRLTGTVAAGPTGPQITTSSTPTAVVGTAYSTSVAATGGTAPYTWSLASGTLPAGVTLAAATGVISGTPTTSGVSPFTVRVTDATSAVFTTALSITVVDPVSVQTTTLPPASIGTSFGQTLSAGGGVPPYTWARSSGTLPAGLTLDAATGLVSGTPTTAGTSTFGVTVTDAESRTAARSLSITVTAALTITTTSMPNGSVGTAYSSSIVATGGATPYSWRLPGGALPDGLSITTAGAIVGTPITAGMFNFTVQVSDVVGRSTTAALSIAVYGPVTITTSTLPAGTVGTPYNVTITTSGGRAPFTWSLAARNVLPAGLTLGASTGTISGTPTAAGSSSFTVQVKDVDGRTTSKKLSLVINPIPGAFAKSSPGNGATGVSRTAKLSWGASANAARYEVCLVATTTAPAVGSFTCTPLTTTTSRTYTPPTMASLTKYHWQVRAIGTWGRTLANGGTWWSFTTA